MKLNTITQLRRFLVFWGAMTVSSLGTQMTKYALILRVYAESGKTLDVTLLTACSLLPSIVFCFAAGALADRWDKKKLLTVCQLLAAAGTLTMLALFRSDVVRLWQLYAINLALGFVGAFSNPAMYVTVTLLTTKEQYVRAGGILSLSRSLTEIIAPLLATALLALGGIRLILSADLVTFAAAVAVLALFVRLPDDQNETPHEQRPFVQSCLDGVRFLKTKRALLRLILFFALVNFLAFMTGYGTLPALILSRTGGDEAISGTVSAAVGLGTLCGGVLVTIIRLRVRKTTIIFAALAASYLICEPLWGLGRSPVLWIIGAVLGNVPVAFVNANMSALMRENIPIDLQGRVFAARDTLQYFPIPLGLVLGGWLADHVFEPLMHSDGAVPSALSRLVGTGDGAGIALMFVLVGIVGVVSSLMSLKNPLYKQLD